MPNFKRITFQIDGTGTTYDLGYHEWIKFDFEGNVAQHIIPRAQGVSLLSTKEMGGGSLKITISAFIAKDTRLELETYIYTLIGNICNQKGTVVVENSLTMTNCYVENISMPGECTREAILNINLTKSI